MIQSFLSAAIFCAPQEIPDRFFEKRDMMLTLVFLRFIGEKFEDGVAKLREDLIAQGLDPDDKDIFDAFFVDATFTDGTYNLPVEARQVTIMTYSKRTSLCSLYN